MKNKVDSRNFDEKFDSVLKEKKGQNIIKGRFDIEPVELKLKLDFVFHFFKSFKDISTLTYKILFWEKDNIIESLLEFSKGKIIKTISYKMEEYPGIIFIDDENLDKIFLEKLLINHFNYEMAENPSLNMRVQICINHKDYITLLDIYDDRGFDVYYFDNG